ncbi:MAG TPA: hypothetical protein VEL73_08045, partial [Mycobacteriales bacterium]|nr:hypothetical protein [Mycobacteriales bacterium]
MTAPNNAVPEHTPEKAVPGNTKPDKAGPQTVPDNGVELGSGWPGWVPRVVLLLAGVGAASALLGNGVDEIALAF